MADTIALNNPPRPAKTKSESKAEVTDNVARAIIEAEARLAEAKTERLRKARLEREAQSATIELADGKRHAKSGGRKRARAPSGAESAGESGTS